MEAILAVGGNGLVYLHKVRIYERALAQQREGVVLTEENNVIQSIIPSITALWPKLLQYYRVVRLTT